MPTAEQVRDLTLDTIGTARDRAADLARDVELPSVDVDELVEQAVSHKLRTTLILTLPSALRWITAASYASIRPASVCRSLTSW